MRRGHGRHAQAGAQLVRRVPGQRADVRGGQHGVLGGGAVAVAEGADRNSHTRSPTAGDVHALAHRVDHADAVLVRDLEVLGVLPGEPARVFQSVGFTPEPVMRTRTSPGPGSGVSTSSTESTSAAGPVRR